MKQGRVAVVIDTVVGAKSVCLSGHSSTSQPRSSEKIKWKGCRYKSVVPPRPSTKCGFKGFKASLPRCPYLLPGTGKPGCGSQTKSWVLKLLARISSSLIGVTF